MCCFTSTRSSSCRLVVVVVLISSHHSSNNISTNNRASIRTNQICVDTTTTVKVNLRLCKSPWAKGGIVAVISLGSTRRQLSFTQRVDAIVHIMSYGVQIMAVQQLTSHDDDSTCCHEHDSLC